MISLALIGQNITIVYKSIDLTDLDSRKIKQLLSDKAVLTEFPNMIVAFDPVGPLVVQVGDNRIRVTLQGESQSLTNLWDVAYRNHLEVKHGDLIAYGFNFDLRVSTPNSDSNEILTKMFLSNQQDISDRLQGKLLSITPRIKYIKDAVIYDLIIEYVDNNKFIAHMNFHYEFEDINLSPDILQKGFVEGYEYLTATLPQLIS